MDVSCRSIFPNIVTRLTFFPSDVVGGAYRGQSPAFPLRHNASTSSINMNASDLSTTTLLGADTTHLTAEQLCDLGL